MVLQAVQVAKESLQTEIPYNIGNFFICFIFMMEITIVSLILCTFLQNMIFMGLAP